MAHVWVFDTNREWVPKLLSGEATSLADRVWLHPTVDPPGTWVVLTSEPGLRLNGLPVPLGLAVLEDRDEIRMPGFTAWFSTETQACVEPFPESASRGYCPRCKQAIVAATEAVRCPQCGLWHHASDELPCWGYAPTCAACDHDTSLDAGFRWSPEEL